MNWRHDLGNFLTKHAVAKGSFKMRRDDMTHMEAVFLPIDRDRPALPYDEFIVESGRHPTGGFAFENKVQVQAYGGHYYAKYEFPNGKKVSVVCGQLFDSRIDAPYEACIDGKEPEGYLTDEELMIILAKTIGDMK